MMKRLIQQNFEYNKQLKQSSKLNKAKPTTVKIQEHESKSRQSISLYPISFRDIRQTIDDYTL